MQYQLTRENYVIRQDGARISTATSQEFPNLNPDYLEYLDWLAGGNAPLPAVALDNNELRAYLLSLLNDEYEERMKVISTQYAQTERESWPVQIEEARSLENDPHATTAWIDSAALARRLDRLELAARIRAKDDAYRVVHGLLTGTRQRIEDAINAASGDAQALSVMDVTVGWPTSPA